MARLSRVVIPGLAHHVTQRGNGRAQVFFDDDDYALYRDWLGGACRAELESGRPLAAGKRGRKPGELSALSP